MNHVLKEIVKDELQKILNVNFIYPISDSKWVSPLVIVPKKNGKWRVYVDFRELNRATLRYYFPLPFINQVLDTLSRKQYFHSPMDIVGITKSKLHWKIKRRPLSHALREHSHIGSYLLDYAMPLQHFKEKSSKYSLT